MLPSYTNDTNNDFTSLFNAYNISEVNNSGGSEVILEDQDAFAATQAPLYFNLSGFVSSESYANGIAASGIYYSNRAYYWGIPEDTDARGLTLRAITYSFSDPWRFNGYSIRCIAR